MMKTVASAWSRVRPIKTRSCLVAMGVVAIGFATPAAASYVMPMEGRVENRLVVSQLSVGSTFQEQIDDWALTPSALSTSTSATRFPTAGGIAISTQQFNADWSSPDAGAIAFDFQTLMAEVPGVDLQTGNSVSRSNVLIYSNWIYRFRATEDSLLTLNWNLNAQYSGTFNDVQVFAAGQFLVNDVFAGESSYVVGSIYNVSSLTRQIELVANRDYLLTYQSIVEVRDTSGNTVFTVSDRPTFAIDARPAVMPPDPQSGVPEPGTWAMMIVGFGMIGRSIRRKGGTTATAVA